MGHEISCKSSELRFKDNNLFLKVFFFFNIILFLKFK